MCEHKFVVSRQNSEGYKVLLKKFNSKHFLFIAYFHIVNLSRSLCIEESVHDFSILTGVKE